MEIVKPKIKKGDAVKVIAGKDRGKSGKVLSLLREKNRVMVEGINMYTKHVKPRKQGQKGEIIHVPRSLHLSNVMIVCPKCGRPTRVGYKLIENEKNRICKKCGSEL